MIIFDFITHLMFGYITSYFISHNITDVLMCLFGSLLPDIDHPKSFLGKANPGARFMKHRGFTHTIIGSAVISSPMLLFGVFWPVYIGCLSHIIADKISSTMNGRAWKIKLY